MFYADKTLATSDELKDKLTDAGWEYREEFVGSPRAAYERPQRVGVFSRTVQHPLKTGISVTEKNSVTRAVLENRITKPLGNGVKGVYGTATGCADPAPRQLLALEDIGSLARMRLSGSCLVIALDTEFYRPSDGQRLILTWQVAFIEPSRPDLINELVFCSYDGKRLPFGFMLSYILSNYDFRDLAPAQFGAFDYRLTRRYVYHTVSENRVIKTHYTADLAEAISRSTLEGERAVLQQLEAHDQRAKPNAYSEKNVPFVDFGKVCNGYVNNFSDFNKFAFPITLLCHAGKADLTTFNLKSADDFIPRLSDVQGGLVSLSDFFLHTPLPLKYWQFFPISLSVRDTMCYAPAGCKRLEDLGKTVGIPKLDVSPNDKDNMLGLLLRDPVYFLEYAINDSVIALCYAGELWQYNNTMPVTVSGAASRAAVPVIASYLGVDFDSTKNARNAYNTAYRGLHTVKKGLSTMIEKAGFIENTALEPVNDNARILQTYAKQAYKGGYNGSMKIGKYDGLLTHDFDLENAYPSAMCLVPDVDWSSAIIANEIVNRPIIRQDFHTPFDLMFGYIKFRFPDNVKYPCIPVSVNGSMVFPQSSDGLDGVYASAPEIYLALCLGAEIWSVHTYVGVYRYNADGSVSHSLRAAVKELVNDRSLAQHTFGKKSLLDLLLKTAVNSLYGKTAQDIIDKETWNAFCDRMDNIGGSLLTSPTHACLTTAIVRCVLLAAMNELTSLGYDVFSVTTDGFISNAPEDVLTDLPLFGFARFFKEARMFLVGSDVMWAEKHSQSDLLNFTTRGNVSLSENGVCAHNSFVTGFPKDSYEDRLALMTAVLGREGRVHCFNKTWTKFRQLASRSDRQDFGVTTQERALSMDFDLKRKPDKSTMLTVFPTVEDVPFEIANFDTTPFQTVAEYERFKKVSKSCKVLRTEKDWGLFFAKAERTDNGGVRVITDVEWSMLFTCVMGYRLGLWDIPYLNNKDLSVAQKVEWINRFNKSSKKFTENSWKNCRRQNRASQMLERAVVAELLLMMQKAGADYGR